MKNNDLNALFQSLACILGFAAFFVLVKVGFDNDRIHFLMLLFYWIWGIAFFLNTKDTEDAEESNGGILRGFFTGFFIPIPLGLVVAVLLTVGYILGIIDVPEWVIKLYDYLYPNL